MKFHFNTTKPKWYVESDHRINPIMQDTIPKDLTPHKPHPHYKGPLKPDRNPTSPYDNLDAELINHKFLLFLVRPDLRILEFPINEMPECLFVAWLQEDMSVNLHWGYSVDSGHTWSPYYENDIDYEKFMQLLRDAYSKGFDVRARVRIEVDLTKEPSYYESLQENAYYVGIENIWLNGTPVSIITSYTINATGIALPQQKQLWDPYAGMDKVYDIQVQASRAINHMFGHWAYYFKTDPDTSTRNITLKSYQLYNVVDMKKIKISVPNNKFPDNKIIWSEWGMALPDEFEVHVLVDAFEHAFGPGEFPHTRDYIYFPLTGKLYNVNAYRKNTNFMYRTIYYECTLVKYEDDTNVIKGEFTDETVNFENLEAEPEYLEDLTSEVEDADPVYLNTKLYDAFRTQLHKSAEIVNFQMNNAYLKLYDNMYRFTGVPTSEAGVIFNLKHCPADNISIYCWLMLEKKTPSRDIYRITDSSGYDVIRLAIEKGVLKLWYDKTPAESNIELDVNTRYGIMCNVSIMYRTIELSILGYNENVQNITKILDISKQEIPVPLVYLLDTLTLMGGKQLIGNVGIDRQCYSQDDIPKILTQVTPNAEINQLFDNAHLPLTENNANGY